MLSSNYRETCTVAGAKTAELPETSRPSRSLQSGAGGLRWPGQCFLLLSAQSVWAVSHTDTNARTLHFVMSQVCTFCGLGVDKHYILNNAFTTASQQNLEHFKSWNTSRSAAASGVNGCSFVVQSADPGLTSPDAGSTAFSRSDTAPASVRAALIRSLPPPTSSSISAASSFTPFDISVRLEEMVVMAQPTAV